MALAAVGAGLLACASTPEPRPSPSPTASPSASPSASVAVPPSALPTRPARPTNAADLLATVRALSERIGPREATSRAYGQAVALVSRRFRDLGYTVRTQAFRVPAGVSWGVPVRAGQSRNVIAEPAGFDPGRPYLIVGAQLDTVPQAPGAEDNASGVAVMLEVARLAAQDPPPLPVVFVAFGAEEPRGPGDAGHHFGSRAYVAAMSAAARRSLVGMVNPDRVGVGSRVPVCTGGRSPATVADALLAQAARLRIPVRRCTSPNRSSDHWSFELAGMTAARVGSTPYPEYHSARDRIGVVRGTQLVRAARLVSATLPVLRPR